MISLVLQAGCICNNALIQNDTLLGQPTEGALIAVAMKNGMYGISEQYVRLQEYPFSSEQKMMAVKCTPKYGDVSSIDFEFLIDKIFFIFILYQIIYIYLQTKQEIFFVKGAMEKILPQCTKYSCDGQILPLNQKKDQEFLTQAYDIGQQGLRGNFFSSSL